MVSAMMTEIAVITRHTEEAVRRRLAYHGSQALPV
ncbi:hypothetical protein MJ8_14340 [Mesorhizobium sp. J8]|nr:hypothetical protein MJ8_14340 [Mesorhizobium sp. J8]